MKKVRAKMKSSQSMTAGQKGQWRQFMESLGRDAGSAVLDELKPGKLAMEQLLGSRQQLKQDGIEFVLDRVRNLMVPAGGMVAGSIPVTEAQNILGLNFFGFDDYPTHCGIAVPRSLRAKVSRFPWSQEILEGACPFHSGKKVRETHFAFLGLERVAKGKPLTIRQWQELCPASGQPRFYSYAPDCWYKDEPFATTPTCQPRWYLALSEIVPGSENKLFEEQERMLPEEYEVPDPVVDVTKHLLFFHEHKMYPNLNRWGATNTLRSRGYRVIVGCCCDRTLVVYYWLGPRHDHVGVGAVRKLPAAGT